MYTNVIDVDTKNGIIIIIIISIIIIIIIINDISEHLTVITFVKYSTCNINSSNTLPTYINVRLLKEYNIEMLSNRLRDLDWTEVTNCNDVNTAYGTFHCIFNNIFNICFPIIRKNVNRKSNHKSWLTPGLVNACK